MINLSKLAELVEAGVGRDRELDCEIYVAINCWQIKHIPKDAKGENESEIYIPPDLSPGFQYPPIGLIGKFYHVPEVAYTCSIDSARSLFPWAPHPCATLNTRLVQSGVGRFLCWVEFTWPSTEIQGRAQDEVRATLACALRAIQRTNEELAPFMKSERKKA
jgi:hypothetical protein